MVGSCLSWWCHSRKLVGAPLASTALVPSDVNETDASALILGNFSDVILGYGSEFDLPSQRWSLDFLHDAPNDGRCFWMPAVVNDHTREGLCLGPDTSLPRSRPRLSSCSFAMCRGPEFNGLAMPGWAQGLGLEWHYIDPAMPQQNGTRPVKAVAPTIDGAGWV